MIDLQYTKGQVPFKKTLNEHWETDLSIPKLLMNQMEEHLEKFDYLRMFNESVRQWDTIMDHDWLSRMGNLYCSTIIFDMAGLDNTVLRDSSITCP